jgi:phosphoribosylformylglycinamidine synthase
VPLVVENSQSAFTCRYEAGEEIVIPIAHHDGNFQADKETLDRPRARAGSPSVMPASVTARRATLPGSSTKGNVLGMMPHPERAVEAAHGRTDGRRLLEGLLEVVSQAA